MTTERPMTPSLLAALAAMTPVERRILRHYAIPREDGFTPFLAALFVGLVAELDALERQEEIDRLHEVAVLHGFELDRIADNERAAEAAERVGVDWSHVPASEPRTKDWWPQTAPDDLSELEP
jgi:hypothetical protein